MKGMTIFCDICDPVFELDEDIRTVIETKSIPRTQILVDPHAHDETITVPKTDKARRTEAFCVASVTLVREIG